MADCDAEVDRDEFIRFISAEFDRALYRLADGPYTIDEWWDLLRNDLEDVVLESSVDITDASADA